jgi:endopeptidase Clp ATP-binding regulatory subunit ClpX
MAGNVPDLNELQKDLKEFFSQKYGTQIQFAQPEQDGAPADPPGKKEPVNLRFDMKPEELEAYLNEYVIRQDEAKEILATKICTHFNRIRLQEEEDEPVGNIKNNIILIGPTGVGKTYLIKLIARKIGVPFVKGDATKFSETGYVGGDVDDMVRALVHEADGDIELAQYGIIYIDEIDKIASAGNTVGPDVSRTGVQRALLKLMEETEVDLHAPHDLASQMESALQFQKTGKIQRKRVNTRNILFIVSGAFAGLEDSIKRRLTQHAMGFVRDGTSSRPKDGEWLPYVIPEDLIAYGFESEFIGRLPVIAVLHPLSADDLFRILKNPNSPVIIAKKRDFRAYGITVDFDDEALRLIAEQAYNEKTGARGLVGVMEKILIKYEKRLPSSPVRRFTVTGAVVEHPDRELERLLAAAAVARFEERFQEAHAITLTLDPEARTALLEAARASGKTVDSLGMELFKDYSHGLKLIQMTELSVPEEAVRSPGAYLDALIKKFYEKQAPRPA